MLKGTIGSSLGWAHLVFGAVLAFIPSCGGTGETGGGRCTPNETQECLCSAGVSGVQTCQSDGTFSVCDCGSSTSNGGNGGTGGSGGKGGAGASTQIGACGDGFEDSGECDPGAENYCPEDCVGTGGTGGAGGDPCAGQVTYAGMVPNVGSSWGMHPQANGKTGYEAGIEVCKTIGADHPCDYEEVLVAQAAGELANIAQGTTAWIHRTTPAMVGGNPSQPGPGGRCNNWDYITNHISDGEYADFMAVGVPTYMLDNDTFYDGVSTAHVQAGLPCGGASRAILCCFPVCVP
ncbi:MAG: hypothetical protein IPK82_14720 [Polyangiaceae bacterium]|nr:hypothetical protein [Polyangiaceae bacterium]